jgi:RHS repeat-associated protein
MEKEVFVIIVIVLLFSLIGIVSAESEVHDIGFTGQRYDDSIGLINFPYRSYDADAGRFLQRDPSGYVDGENLYEYVSGNALSEIDELGLQKGIIDDIIDLAITTGRKKENLPIKDFAPIIRNDPKIGAKIAHLSNQEISRILKDADITARIKGYVEGQGNIRSLLPPNNKIANLVDEVGVEEFGISKIDDVFTGKEFKINKIHVGSRVRLTHEGLERVRDFGLIDEKGYYWNKNLRTGSMVRVGPYEPALTVLTLNGKVFKTIPLVTRLPAVHGALARTARSELGIENFKNLRAGTIRLTDRSDLTLSTISGSINRVNTGNVKLFDNEERNIWRVIREHFKSPIRLVYRHPRIE